MVKINKVNKETFLYETLIDLNRVSKVTKGGRRFAYRAIMLVGDNKGYVGYGIAVHIEVAEAKAKANKNARKSLNAIRVKLCQNRTIYHEVWGKFNASKVFLKPANPGTGIIAGGAVRKICNIAGIVDIIGKSYGSSSNHNLIMAVFDALKKIYTPQEIAKKRGKKLSDIREQRLL